MKELTTSVYSFADLIKGNFLYIDKTEYVWQLIKPTKEMYFLSRPRRFGKSLLISTLEAVFKGQKELFKGLAIYDKPYDWKRYPVIHLDINGRDLGTPEKMEERFRQMLVEQAEMNGVKLKKSSSDLMFHELIKALHDSFGDVVVLIDEYDKPILDNVSKPNFAEYLNALKVFYSVIKEKSGMLRFAFITGVSKFSHVSIFSDLNNLTDITLSSRYAGMLGFTEDEIRNAFADRLPAAAISNGVSEEELMGKILNWYDGYRFSEGDTHVCNPVSINKFFANDFRFSNYWDSTGTPTFLLELMGKQAYEPEKAFNDWYDESVFSAYEIQRLDITGLLWQTGYLTIKDVRRDADECQYRLDFPDREVRETFNRRLIEFFAGADRSREAVSLVRQFRTALRNNEPAAFLTLLKAFLANIDYSLHIPQEKYYQTVFFVVFKLLGVWIEAESRTNEGRIDAYVRTSKAVYIFEFKLNKTARRAVAQIIDRHYYEKFMGDGLPIRLFGVNFNSSKGQITNWEEKSSI